MRAASLVGAVQLGGGKGSAAALCLSQEYDASKATFVKVVPTPNNGSTELVALHRDEVGTCCWAAQPRVWVGGGGVDSQALAGMPRLGASATEMPLLPQGEDGQEVLSFEFQKIKYSYDALEKKRFLPVAFPVGNAFSYYQSNRGFQEDSEIRAAEKKFGSNK